MIMVWIQTHALPPSLCLSSLHHIVHVVESLKQKTLDEDEMNNLDSDEMNNLDSDDDTHIPGGNIMFTLELGYFVLIW